MESPSASAKQKINFLSILGWFFGLSFIVIGCGVTIYHVPAGFLQLLFGLYILPPFQKWLDKVSKAKLSTLVKVIIGFFIIALSSILNIQYLSETSSRVTGKVPSSSSLPNKPAGYLSQSMLGEKWPLTVDEGIVECRNGAIIFKVRDKEYAVNGLATTWYPDLPDIKVIWADNPSIPGTKKNISVIIDRGNKLCD